jgi:uncharacterized protein YbjQ (UPF0145 family)
VELTVKRMEWDDKILEFIAIGTGVVHAKGHTGFKGHAGKPFTSDLSGQDFWTLLQAGYRPLEMVMGSCVYHVAHQGMFKALGNVGNNVELTNFSQALYDAREIAMERMQHEASAVKAEGVVGVDLHEGSHNWKPHIIEFFAVGTAVTPITTERDASTIPDPQLVLSVNN